MDNPWENYNEYEMGFIITNNKDLILCQKIHKAKGYTWLSADDFLLTKDDDTFPIVFYIGRQRCENFGHDIYTEKMKERIEEAGFPLKHFSGREVKLERILGGEKT